MVRTRSGVATNKCNGSGQCRRWYRGRWRQTKACTKCRVQRCRNAIMCKSTATKCSSKEFYCSRCVAFLACRPVSSAGPGECPVCMESQPLFGVPSCVGGHSLCGACLRRMWMGTDSLPATAAEVVTWTHRNRKLLQHQQQCPCCRAADTRTAADRPGSIYKADCDTSCFARAVVIVGLSMVALENEVG